MAPNMNQRRAVLNNTELVRRLQAVGEHRKASLLYHGTSGDAHATHRGLRAAEQPVSYTHLTLPTIYSV